MTTPRGAPSRVRFALSFPLFAVVLTALTAACVLHASPASPPSVPSPEVRVRTWEDTARTVLDTARWLVPAARVALDALLPADARAPVDLALDGVSDAAAGLTDALDAWEQGGGDRCAAFAASSAARVALLHLADVLADRGVALGAPLGRLLDGVAALADTLVPACAPRASWGASLGDDANAHLRTLERRAADAGLALRRDLDRLTPEAP